MRSSLFIRAAAFAAIAAGLAACQSTDGTDGVKTTAARNPSGRTAPAAAVATATPAVAAPAAVRLPNVVGQRLEQAETVLTARGFTNVNPVDATGQGRAVVNPENWIVTAQTPRSGSPTRGTAAVTLTVEKPSDAADSSSSQAVAGTVPNVVCMDLQRAQDTLQAAGFYDLGSQDGTGQGRMQLVDRNWVVTAQSAPAGSHPDAGTRIVLTAVKFGEPTGNSGCSS